ncbi:MAG: tyrosine--tRNA ligase [Candidatus Hadarchaeota archaeon]|nr:tyrosine--tRNA ligase [Candidatus Hadarchaeota archaeon]
MDLAKRLALIKEVGEEIVTEKELKELLETKEHPVAYDGFEPSGIAHLPFGVYRAINLKKMIKAGIKFKLLLADWFAWINNKMGGDLEKIRKVGEYFVEVWRAASVPMNKIEVLWSSEIVNKEYWKTVTTIAKNHNLRRTMHAMSIAGREGTLKNPAAWAFYPSMQVADIFSLNVDICQLGKDQRRANMLAREIAPKIGRKKPVVVHHHMLMGLHARSMDEKMSKSEPATCIYVHDSEEEIQKKIEKAYCPEKQVENNPILDYTKHLISESFDSMEIRRKEKYGGDITFYSFSELKQAYKSGELHPLDLKRGVTEYVNLLIAPIREYFERNRSAKELYEFVKAQEITR